jgi:hypothetical protein
MTITDEQRDEVYTNATEQQQYLYSNPESGRRMFALATKYSLATDESYKKFAFLVGDVILGFFNRTELPTLLTTTFTLTEEQALGITADILDFLENKETATETNSISLPHINPSTETAIKEGSSTPLPSTPVAAVPETAEAPISRIRTMAGDMAKSQVSNEIVYSSSQEALLREATSTPKAPATKPTEGSWG